MRDFLDNDVAMEGANEKGFLDDFLSDINVGNIIASDPIGGRFYSQSLAQRKPDELDIPADSPSLFERFFKREPEPDEYGGIRPFEIFPKPADAPEVSLGTPSFSDPAWEMEKAFREEAERQVGYRDALNEGDRQRREKAELYGEEWAQRKEREFGGPNAPIDLFGVEKDAAHIGKAVQNILPHYMKNRAGATMVAAFEKQQALENRAAEDVLKETSAYLRGTRPTEEDVKRVKSEPDDSSLLEGARMPGLTDVEAALLMRADAAERKGDVEQAAKLRGEVEQRVVDLAKKADSMAKYAEEHYVHYERPLNYWHNAILSTIESSGHTIASSIRSGAAWALGGPVLGMITSFLNTGLEAESEAGEVLTYLLEEGEKSPEEIRKAVDAARARNVAVLSVTNPLGDYLVFGSEKLAGLLAKGIPGKGIVSGGIRAAVQRVFPFTASAAPEAVEEVAQSYITSLGTGVPLQEHELRDSAVQGALGAIIYGGVGKVARSATNFATQSFANGKASTATESLLAGILLAKQGKSTMDNIQAVADFNKVNVDDLEIAKLPESTQREFFILEKAQELIEGGGYKEATDMLSGETSAKDVDAMIYTPQALARMAMSKTKVRLDESKANELDYGVLYTANGFMNDGDYEGALNVLNAYGDRQQLPPVSSVEEGKGEAVYEEEAAQESEIDVSKEPVDKGVADAVEEPAPVDVPELRDEDVVLADEATEPVVEPIAEPVDEQEATAPLAWWQDAPLIERHREEIAKREKAALVAVGTPVEQADAQSQIVASMYVSAARREENPNVTPLEWYGEKRPDVVREERAVAEKAEVAPVEKPAPVAKGSLNDGLHSFVDVESIVPVGDRASYDQDKIESMADEMLRVGVYPEPLLVRSVDGDKFEVVGDGLRYWAAVRAREKDARRGEMTSALVVEGEAEAFDNQRGLRGEPVHPDGHVIDDRGQALVDVSAITPLAKRSEFDEGRVDSLASSMLDLGGLVSPIALRRTGAESFETIGDDLAYWAAVRAKEMNPRFEMVNAFIYEPVQEGVEAPVRVEPDRESITPSVAEGAREGGVEAAPAVETEPDVGGPLTGERSDYVARVENSINERARRDLFMAKGAELFPTLRMQEHEEAGRLAYLVEKGDVTQDEFDAIVEEWRNENRFQRTDDRVEPEDSDMIQSVRGEVSVDDGSGDDANHPGPLAEGVSGGVQEAVEGEGIEPGEGVRELDSDGNENAEVDTSGHDGLRGVDGVEAPVLYEAAAGAGTDVRLRGRREADRGAGEENTGEAGEAGTFTTPPGLGQSVETIEATTRSGKKRDSKREGTVEIAGENPGNFVIGADFALGEGTNAVKIQQNIDALKVLKRVKSEKRFPTREEQAVMARYVGWGGLPGVFDAKNAKANNMYGKAQRALRSLLTAEEYNAAAISTQNAHYTPKGVVNAMWRLARHFGFKGGRVLEPTVGVGNFLGLQPQDMASATEWHASELDAVSGEMAAMLYPDANVLAATGFEDAPFADGAFDLVVGNPPFGSMAIQGGIKPDIRGMRIHNYVIAKSGEHLRPGGVMMMVVTHRFLDTDNAEARSHLADQFKFLGAVRLPNDAFRKNAGTDVVTDIIMLQKLRPGEVADRGAAWLDVNGNITVDGQDIRVNRYYEENPSHILGKSATDGSMYARGAGEEYTVHSDGRDLSKAIDELITTDFADLSGIMTPTDADANLGAAMLERSSLPIGGLLLDNDGRILRREMDDDLGNAVILEVTKDTLWKDNAKEWEAIVDILSEVRDTNLKGDVYGVLEPFISVAYKGDGEKFSSPEGYVQALYDIVDAAKEGDFEWRFDEELGRIEAAYRRKQLGENGLARLRGLLDLRNRLLALNIAELSDAPEIEALRSGLNTAYDAFVKKYGFVNNPNNLRLLENDVGPEAGLESSYKKGMSKQAAAKLGETKAIPDEATKADIFFARVNFPTKEITSADGPVDALKISLSERGAVDIAYMAGLTKMSPSEVLGELMSGDNPQIFINPETGDYEHADVYLSGNVKKKLAEAIAAGDEKNIAALRRVQPEPKTAKQITPGIRSAWMPEAIFAEFLEALGGEGVEVSIIQNTGQILASVRSYNQTPLGMTYTNNDGKSIVDLFNSIASGKAMEIAGTDANGNRYVDTAASERVNNLARRMDEDFQRWAFSDEDRTATIVDAFNEKMNTHVARKFDGVSYLHTVGLAPSLRLRNAQKNAAWRMIQSRTMLHDHVVGLGKTFSNIVGVMERKRLGLSQKPLIVVPNHLVIQWAADFYKAYPNARILAATPADFSLKNRRKLFARMATGNFDAIIIGHSSFQRIAQPSEDAVMVMREQVDLLRAALEETSADKSASSRRTVKMIQNKIQRYEDRVSELLKKAGEKGEKIGNEEFSLDFKTLGIDYLVVDEAHEFKNLEYATMMDQVVGMNNSDGSEKAFDLYVKIRGLLERGGGVSFATGTPVANSLIEIYTMMKYLAHDELKERGHLFYDAWAGAYIQTEMRAEYTPSQQLKMRNVLSGLTNLSSLQQIYQQFADTITMDKLKEIYRKEMEEFNRTERRDERTEFPVPKVREGKRRLVVIPESQIQSEVNEWLVARIESMSPQDRKSDNMLYVMNDARKAALDVRMILPYAGRDENGKVVTAAREIKRIYDQWDDKKGTQLVFCDLSTPTKQAETKAKEELAKGLTLLWGSEKKAKERVADAARLQKDARGQGDLQSPGEYEQLWNETIDGLETLRAEKSGEVADRIDKFLEESQNADVIMQTADTGFSAYDDLRRTLNEEYGIPLAEIAFIHEYENSERKDEMFKKVQRGLIRVLIGSSAKMGAGMNVQDRLVALHHLDAPWRPSDVEQREGRIIRQGNLFYEADPDGFEVEILAYSAQASNDSVMWQILERKAKGIEQFRSGEDIDSIMEDSSDAEQFADFKASTTGDPVYKLELEAKRRLGEAEASNAGRLTAYSNAEAYLRDCDANRESYEKRLENALDIDENHVDVKQGKAVMDTVEADHAKEKANWIVEKERAERGVKAWQDAPAKTRGKKPELPKAPKMPTVYREKAQSELQYARRVKKALDEMMEKAGEDEARRVVRFGKDFEIEVVRTKPQGEVTNAYRWQVRTRKNGMHVSPSEIFALADPRNSGMFMRLFDPRYIVRSTEAEADRLKGALSDMERKKSASEQVVQTVPSREDVDNARSEWEWYRVQVAFAEARSDLARDESAPNRFIEKDSRELKRRPAGKLDRAGVIAANGVEYDLSGVSSHVELPGESGDFAEATRVSDGAPVILRKGSKGGEPSYALWREQPASAREGGETSETLYQRGRPASVGDIAQAISSANTSQKQVAATFKSEYFVPGDRNLDIGGGRYDLGTEFLAERGTENVIFDPFNRPPEENAQVIARLKGGEQFPTVTVNNVLNIIAEQEVRENVILQAAKGVEDGGSTYFLIHEGDRTGESGETTRGWQNNAKAEAYMPEVEKFFGDVQRKGRLIIAKEPVNTEMKAAWDTGAEGERTFFQNAAQLDAEYMAAVEAGDMETAQRMVDKAAGRAGYTVLAFKGMPSKAWRTGEEITVLRSANGDWAGFFSSDKDVADKFRQAFATMGDAKLITVYLDMDGAVEVDAQGGKARDFQFDNVNPVSRRNNMLDLIDSSERGVIVRNTEDEGTVYIAKTPNQIKSANPVTYDDQGNVIPLSQRFDIAKDDLRYQGEGDDAKGSITFFRDSETQEATRRPEIRLFENADASTFMHESAHFFLNDLLEKMNAEERSEETVDLFRRLDNWLKLKRDEHGSVVASEEQHEKFALGFEEYLERGVPPKGATGLRAVFEKFRAWLKEIFSSARRLKVKITDEVADIYDRFLTTPEERAAAERAAVREEVAETALKKMPLETEPTPSGAATGSIYGSETTVRAPGFPKPLTVRYKVVEASDLVTSHSTTMSINEAYPSELQPRDRERMASLQQVERMAADLDVHRLGEGRFSNESGAPIMSKDGNVVIVGNGRSIAIKAAYERGLADEYKAWVRENASEFGLDVKAVEGMEQPVLVRELFQDLSHDELVRFANASNTGTNAAMSVAEQATTDAKAIDDALLSKLGKNGGMTMDFLGEFMRRVVVDAERGAFLDSDGNPSSTAVERAENALFEYAYDSPWLTSLRSEREDSDVITVTNALARSAGAFAKAKLDMRRGYLNDVDITTPIEGAVRFFRTMKREGFTAKGRDRQANRDRAAEALNQSWMFGEYEQDSAETIIAAYINENSRSAKAISKMLDAYVEELRKMGAPTRGLFGEETVAVPVDVLARNAVEAVDSPEGLFDFMTPKGDKELAGKQRAWEAPRPSEDPEAQALGLRQIRDLVKKILPLRFKNTQKRTGVYKSQEEIARIAGSYDFPAAMHEVGHHVMEVLGLNTKLTKGMMKELRKLGQQTARAGSAENVVLAEGVAQFVQHYMINEAAARDVAPGFYLEFEARLKDPGTDAEFLANLMDLQDAINNFYAAPPESRVLAHVRSAGGKTPYTKALLGSKIKRGLYKTYETLVDDKFTWKFLTDRVGKSEEGKAEMERNGGFLPDRLDFYAQVMTLAGYRRLADSDVDGMMSFVKGLNEAEYKQLLAYAVSLQSLEYFDNDMNPGTGKRSDHEAVVARTPEKIKDALAGLQDVYNSMMENTLVETGIISRKGFEAMREKWKNYVPFMRDLDEEGFIDWLTRGAPKQGSNLRSYVDLINPTKKRGGVGERERTEIFDPIEVMIHNAVVFHGLKSRNDFAKGLVDAASELKGFGWLAERVDAVPKSELKRRSMFYVWRDGQKEYYATDPELYPLLKGMYDNGKESGIPGIREMVKVMEMSADLFKKGTTRYNPGFAPKNFLIDAFGAGIQSESWAPPFIPTLKGLLMQYSKNPKHKQLIEDAINDGVFYSAITSLPRGSGLEDIARELRDQRKLNSATGMERALRSIMSALPRLGGIVGDFNEKVEMAPKLYEYEYLRRKKPQMGRKRAGMKARSVNIDFERAGSGGRRYNKITAFFNPTVQGVDKMFRTMKERPVQSLAKVMMYQVLPAVLLRLAIMANPDDEEKYQRINPGLRDSHFCIPVQNEALGANVWLRIPKAEQWWVFAAVFERMITEAAKNDPEAWKGFAHSVMEDFIPPWIPTFAAPIWEAWGNRNMFAGRPVVSKRYEHLPADLQYRVDTTETAKLLGKMTGQSPIMLDYVWEKYTGTVGAEVLSLAESTFELIGVKSGLMDERTKLEAGKVSDLPFFRRFFYDTTRAGEPLNRFYEYHDQLLDEKKRAEFNGTPFADNALLREFNSVRKRFSELNKRKDRIRLDERLPREKKRELMDMLENEATMWAKAAMDLYYKAKSK